MSHHRVGIINYGLGNISSIREAFLTLGCHVELLHEAKDLEMLSHIVLPGVGAFQVAMENLRRLDLTPALIERVRAGIPLMGICLGMQLLLSDSDEFGVHPGLDLIKGHVVRLEDKDEGGQRLRVPNIGWAKIAVNSSNPQASRYFRGLEDADYYFVHSYKADPASDTAVGATAKHGNRPFTAALVQDNILATQFHPENSGTNGLRLLANWLGNS